MLKDKKDDPDKKIPAKFKDFIKSPEYRELLESMLDYCRVLFLIHYLMMQIQVKFKLLPIKLQSDQKQIYLSIPQYPSIYTN